LQGLQQKLQHHLELAKDFRQKVAGHPDFEILAPTTMNVVCFRMRPTGVQSEEKLNELNEELLHAVNATGKIYITHTKLGGIYTLRMVIAQTHVEGRHVEEAWQVLQGKARTILSTISGSRT
jgi:aromatic-L-amino-acid decarboxylase